MRDRVCRPPASTLNKRRNSRSKYLFEVNARKTIDGAPRWNKARYINHSCRPNCEPNIYKGRVFIHARRRIKPGEELAYDYGKNYFDEYLKGLCRCPKCQPAKAEDRARAQPLPEKCARFSGSDGKSLKQAGFRDAPRQNLV